ncbi:hypothetical protein ACU4GA_04240 [Methylobacterium oryzae CBMB20]
MKAVDVNGKGPDGQRITDIPDAETTLPALFRAEIGGDNEPLRTKTGGYVWYDVTGIDAAHDKPLDQVKDGVKAGWTATEIAKRLQAKGRELVEKINKGRPSRPPPRRSASTCRKRRISRATRRRICSRRMS